MKDDGLQVGLTATSGCITIHGFCCRKIITIFSTILFSLILVSRLLRMLPSYCTTFFRGIGQQYGLIHVFYFHLKRSRSVRDRVRDLSISRTFTLNHISNERYSCLPCQRLQLSLSLRRNGLATLSAQFINFKWTDIDEFCRVAEQQREKSRLRAAR